VIGEIGGSEEEELAETLLRERFGKPVALLAGTTAPEGVTMGHAGALVHGTRGTAASKVAALSAAGVRVHATMRDIVEDMARVLASAPRIAQSRP
jgi:succinyl-CoA synthetase alpha subunit